MHAVVRAMRNFRLQRRDGDQVQRNGEIEFLETIEIQYKKPFKYRAHHSYNGFKKQYQRRGKLAEIEPDRVTVENIFPEKSYGATISASPSGSYEYAVEVNTLGTETLFGH